MTSIAHNIVTTTTTTTTTATTTTTYRHRRYGNDDDSSDDNDDDDDDDHRFKYLNNYNNCTNKRTYVIMMIAILKARSDDRAQL